MAHHRSVGGVLRPCIEQGLQSAGRAVKEQGANRAGLHIHRDAFSSIAARNTSTVFVRTPILRYPLSYGPRRPHPSTCRH